MNNAQLTQAWLSNPLVDPDNKTIKTYGVEYNELYDIAYNHLQTINKLDKEIIKARLPKEHLLFNGSFDILYYEHNKKEFSKDEQQIYEFINMSIYKFGNNMTIKDTFKTLINNDYGVIEWIVCYSAFDEFAEYTYRYIEYLDTLLKRANQKDGSDYSSYLHQADMIKEQYQQIKYLYKISNSLGFTEQLRKVILSEWGARYVDKKSIESGLNIVLKCKQIQSAFEALDTDIYEILIALFKELQRTYDFERKPEQSPIVIINELKYIQDPVQAIIDEMDSASLANSTSQMTLSTRTPKSIQKRASRIYKELHDMGLQDLMKMTSISNNPLATRNRGYFRENILYAADDNKLRCNHNIEAITHDDMNADNYPLAKLQVMFQLHTKNGNGNIIRTDCFYAPVFYNYIVSKVLKHELLINPITKNPLKPSDIDTMVDIMRYIVPNVQHPLIKSYDKDLHIYTVLSNDAKYYEFIIVKNLGRIKIKICQVCIIPNMQEKIDIIMTISQLIKQLFDKQLLLYNYLPPYFINNKEYIKIGFMSTYNNREYWRNGKEKKLIKLLQQIQNFL